MDRVWDVLKKEFTQGYRPGTIGYKDGIVSASNIFVLVRPFLNNQHREVDHFNQDGEVANAISVIGTLKSAGVM